MKDKLTLLWQWLPSEKKKKVVDYVTGNIEIKNKQT